MIRLDLFFFAIYFSISLSFLVIFIQYMFDFEYLHKELSKNDMELNHIYYLIDNLKTKFKIDLELQEDNLKKKLLQRDSLLHFKHNPIFVSLLLRMPTNLIQIISTFCTFDFCLNCQTFYPNQCQKCVCQVVGDENICYTLRGSARILHTYDTYRSNKGPNYKYYFSKLYLSHEEDLEWAKSWNNGALHIYYEEFYNECSESPYFSDEERGENLVITTENDWVGSYEGYRELTPGCQILWNSSEGCSIIQNDCYMQSSELWKRRDF